METKYRSLADWLPSACGIPYVVTIILIISVLLQLNLTLVKLMRWVDCIQYKNVKYNQ